MASLLIMVNLDHLKYQKIKYLQKDYQKGINIFKDSLYPKEFEEEIQRTNQPISVALENKITEDFIEPFKAFRGSGHTLK